MLEHPGIFKYSPQGSENLEVRTISREDVVNFIEELETTHALAPLLRPALGLREAFGLDLKREILW